MRILVTIFLIFAGVCLGRSAYQARGNKYCVAGNLFASIMMLVSCGYVWF